MKQICENCVLFMRDESFCQFYCESTNPKRTACNFFLKSPDVGEEDE